MPVVGNHEAGKIIFINKLLGQDGGTFEPTKATIGVDFYLINISITKYYNKLKDDLRVVAQLWDFSEDEEFREILPYYLSGSQGGIAIFNVSQKSSFQSTVDRIERFWKYIPDNLPFVIIGDMTNPEERGITRTIVSHELAKIFTHSNQYDYIETSISEMTQEEAKNILESLVEKIVGLAKE
ncbi:MAG: hypothetical protein ACW981_15690 [Candidatus Hodarchaeales archaeon]